MTLLTNGVSNSVLNSKSVHVNASSLPEPKSNWSVKVKGKVWVNDSGLIIENNSYITNDLPVRQFFIFKNQDDYDHGRLSACEKNLGTAKITAEKL